MSTLCSRCNIELDFDPLDNEVYDYIDVLCDRCFQDSVRIDEDYDDCLLPPIDFTHEEFIGVTEMDCD